MCIQQINFQKTIVKQERLYHHNYYGNFFDNYFTYFVPVFKYCYSDSRNLWTVMREGGLAP